jgi:hypothetical protein
VLVGEAWPVTSTRPTDIQQCLALAWHWDIHHTDKSDTTTRWYLMARDGVFEQAWKSGSLIDVSPRASDQRARHKKGLELGGRFEAWGVRAGAFGGDASALAYDL